MELKKIGVLSFSKIATLFGVVYGLIVGILFSYTYSKGSLLKEAGIELPPMITTLGYKSLVLMPIFYGVTYFITGAIAAFLYNVFSSWVGGIKVELTSPKISHKKKK